MSAGETLAAELNNDDTYKILTLTSHGAVSIANALCQNSEFAENFQRVSIRWRPRGFLSSQDLLEQEYDLLLNRRFALVGLLPKFDRYYADLAYFPSYPVYWISKSGEPQLTQEYFADKTVGLIDDFYSQSLYILPKQSLNNAGIKLGEEQIKYYADINALFNTFHSGEVDLITSTDPYLSGNVHENLSTLKIPENAPKATWFINKQHEKLSCIVFDALSISENYLLRATGNCS